MKIGVLCFVVTSPVYELLMQNYDDADGKQQNVIRQKMPDKTTLGNMFQTRLEPGTQPIRCRLSILLACVHLQGSFVRIQTFRICKCGTHTAQSSRHSLQSQHTPLENAVLGKPKNRRFNSTFTRTKHSTPR